MQAACLALLIASVFSQVSAAVEALDWKRDRVRARDIQLRTGLPNVAGKLAADEPLTMVFLGGSITENRAGFSTQIPEWLRVQYPRAKVRAINAGWSGTGSDLGAARADRDVLHHKPDLVFVEFAVNDSTSPQVASMERIVRKIWTANPHTDIAFLYTLGRPDLDFYKRGWFPLSSSIHEKVAAHYNIPSIALGKAVADRVNTGSLAWEKFSADMCHPTAAGYEIYFQAFTAAFAKLLLHGNARDHALPAPLTPHLELYPAPIAAEPLSAPAEFVVDDQVAVEVWELPVPGRQWVGDPEYVLNGKTIWRLRWQPWLRMAALEPGAGLDRAAWGGGLEWLEEAGFFCGPSGRWLAGGRATRGAEFGATSSELSVVTFTAPSDGRYAVRFGAEGVARYQAAEKSVALNVVHFPAEENRGRSVAFHTSSKAAMQPFLKTAELPMRAGDDLAFEFLVRDIGGGASYTGITIRVGCFSSKPRH